MKTTPQLCVLCFLAALTAAPLSARVESLKIEPTLMPQLSPSMRLDGVTEGRLKLAIGVDAQGHLSDWLVLAYSHKGLIAPCVDAMKSWKFTPARVDGTPVPTQTELMIHYTADGVVVSYCLAGEMLDAQLRQIKGPQLIERPCSPDRLDHAPERVATVSPLYAKDAESQGVHGTVRVYFYIDQTGAVRMPAVAAGAHPYLCDAAVQAVRQWRYQPPTSHGEPVLVAAQEDFTFGR